MTHETQMPEVDFANVDILLDALRFRVEQQQALNQGSASDPNAERAIRAANEAYHSVAEQLGITPDMDRNERDAQLAGRVGSIAVAHIGREELVEALYSYSAGNQAYSDEAKRASYLAEQFTG